LTVLCQFYKGAHNKRIWEHLQYNNEVFNKSKERIQSEFRTILGLIVDRVKTGYGTSNDGNTARTFFRNPEISAEITKIDVNLIKNIALILATLSSCHKINMLTFRKLLSDTHALYLEKYVWYYMPVTVHKILIHGCDIINQINIPVGFLSEEALEARHKEIRKFRLNHSRKSSREFSNKDVLKRLLLSSEPLITSNRKALNKKQNFAEDIRPYIILPGSDKEYDSLEDELE